MMKHLTLDISTELAQALWDGSRKHSYKGSPVGNKPLGYAWSLLRYYGINQQDLTLTPALVIDWCVTWWGEEALAEFIDRGLLREPYCSEQWDTPILRSFMTAVLQIYRLVLALPQKGQSF